MIAAGDKVKILDFGLAKALADERQSADASQSPTITEAMTQPGIVLGTAAYMSPEQAKGKAVDKRADIWAFGCILYECLTGKKAFEGETVTETLAAILKGEPDWHALPAATPPNIRFVLRRCLEKEMSRRFRDAADVRIIIEEARGIGETTARMKRPWLAWSAAALFLLVALVLAFIYFREKPPSASAPIRFQIALPAGVNMDWGNPFEISPDGRQLAFSALGSDSVVRIWIRALDSLEARSLPGTENRDNTIPPFFWSPDSRFIVFYGDGRLKKVSLTGGPAQTICDIGTAGGISGGSWNRNGTIIFGSGEGLKQVSAAGGVASPLGKADPTRHILGQLYPTFLPDGRHFLYFQNSDIPENRGGYIGSLDSRPEEQGPKQLLATTSAPHYVPPQDSGPGQILFLREQTLMVQPFDDKRLELVGEPVPVAENVGSFVTFGYFSASTNGVLVYQRGGAEQLTRAMWFNRQGKGFDAAVEPGGRDILGLALAPDSSRTAVSLGKLVVSSGQATACDIWLLDPARGTNTRLTFGRGNNVQPVWSPDGRNIIFSSNRDGAYNLYQKLASGVKDEELLLKSSDTKVATSWSSNGRFLLYTTWDPKTKADLWVIPVEGDRKPMLFLRTEFNELDAHFSPDMRWVAYVSDESGSNEVYVREFSKDSMSSSASAGKWQVSAGGGTGPRWRRDGKELYYWTPNGKVMAAEVKAGTVFQWGNPKPLFQVPPVPTEFLPIPLSMWDVASDGDRFLLSTPAAESTQAPFTVVLNWTSLLNK